MANERQWNAVPPVALTANGTTTGILQVADTAGFFFGMEVLLKSNSSQLTLFVKMVVDSTTIHVGPKKGGLDFNVDLSAFTTANNSMLSAAAQNKSTVPLEARMLATYETDPIDAWRVRTVDEYGNGYTDTNPLPVAIEGSISIGTVEVKGPNGNFIEPNTDGSLNVNIVSVPVAGNTVKNIYNEANSVVSGATTTLVQYTVPGGLTGSILQRISVSGENIAKFTVFWNGVQIDTRRTFFGSSLSEYFEFVTGSSDGFTLAPADVLLVQVLHNRPYVGDFEGRIQVLEIA
jgi:hypothetical protein